jgi:uncharacterized protein DUF4129
MLAEAMSASRTRIAAAVIALTTLICVVVIAADEPIPRHGTEPPYMPSREDLLEIGVITDDFPVPGALPPEIFPAEAWGVSEPGLPAWLPWALIAIASLWLAVRLARELPRAGRPRWRRRVVPDEPDDAGDDALAAVGAALAPLREPADPRAAVIEAYVRMERVLAERELGRRASEAPREYLRRVLSRWGAPEDSLTTLTELFEQARFSRRPVTEIEVRKAERELRALT